ncbi:MerR family transcriptional regulator [Vagococcus lutrae]|uniref:MerR family transcriptional regulator n=1 Tax=Vagococcus lutrae TaxID=81947 RepID=UPI00200BC031|nr:MerR family transcriptional regulator [Vagococcus lutrae]UQF12609.1 MerR family transcriptional regulator [Vagococcus lutrae]
MKIREVSELYDMSADTLRYYEKIGLIPPVPKISGQRVYDENSLEHLTFIQCMKTSGLSLAEIKQYQTWFREGDATLLQRLKLLEAHYEQSQQRLKKLQESIDYVAYKIDLTKQNLTRYEGKE